MDKHENMSEHQPPCILFAGAGSQQQIVNGSLTRDGHTAGKYSDVLFWRHKSGVVCC
jgi:hypothetical protein